MRSVSSPLSEVDTPHRRSLPGDGFEGSGRPAAFDVLTVLTVETELCS